MVELSGTLKDRVKAAVRLPQRTELILSTTGTRAAVGTLAERVEALEEAVRELDEKVQAIAEANHRESV